MIELEAIYTIWLREMIRYIRAKERLVASVVRPIFWLFIFGTGIRAPVFGGQIDYTSFIAPGVVVMSLMFTAMYSGITVIWDKELGFMKEMLVAPVSRLSIVIGKSLGGATTALIQGIVVLLLVFGVQSVSSEYFSGVRMDLMRILILIPLMILISIGIVGLGIAIASFLDTLEGFGLIMNFVVMPMFFMSGAMYPISNLPESVKIVSYLDPATYSVELVRYVMTGFSTINLGTSLMISTIFSISMIILATYIFKKKG